MHLSLYGWRLLLFTPVRVLREYFDWEGENLFVVNGNYSKVLPVPMTKVVGTFRVLVLSLK